MLHDSSVCFKSSGFDISSDTIKENSKGQKWKHYSMESSDATWHVRSIILSQEGKQSWDNIGEWFWAALFSDPQNQYLAITELTQ